jgi:DNA-binding transcriptional ArsR family regulator
MSPTKRQQAQRRATLPPHPGRDEIIDAVRSYGGPISPIRLSEVTGKSLASVQYHVRTLWTAGVLALADERRARGAVQRFYTLVPENEVELNDPVMGLQRIFGFLTLPGHDGAYPRRVVLDDQARADMQRLIDALRPKVEKIVTEAAKRTA